MKKEELRLSIILKDLEVYKKEFWKPFLGKNTAESIRARKEGNELFTAGRHSEKVHVDILRLYNRSCAFALPGSPELGLALGNRSALLMHLHRYTECLEDIEQALALPLADDLVATKYLVRKAECHARLAQPVEARDACEEAQILLSGTDGDARQKRSLAARLLAVLDDPVEVPEPETPRPKLPLVTDAILEHRQRLCAAREIAPGEVLFAIQPYAMCPQEVTLHISCSHCLRFCWAAVTCKSCAHAVYCSEGCRTLARQEYHEQECRVIDGLWRQDGRRGAARLLALRLLLRALNARDGNLKALREDLVKPTNTTPGSDHVSVLGLPIRTTNRFFDELLEISKDSAVMLQLFAERSPYFRRYFEGDGKELAGSEDALFIGRLLSQYQHIICGNAQAVKDAYTRNTRSEWTWTHIEEKNCSGIYLTPYLSLLGHSCDPNIKRCEMEDGRTVLYSIKPISEGEQLLDCYGPAYYEMKKTERLKLLSKFHSICECIACKEDWPLFKKMFNRNVRFISLTGPQIDATLKAQQKCDGIIVSLKDKNTRCDQDMLSEIAYGVYLTAKFCKLPNWRLPNLTSALAAIFNDLYGYSIDILDKC